MRLLICAGGTGGGVYPANAVLNTLTRQSADIQVLWVGSEGGMEARLVERANIPFKAIPAAGVHGIGLRQLPGNLIKIGRGMLISRKIIHDFKPDVLFFTGGYVAVPMALAGPSIPTLLYVPDIEPGLALKTIAHFADRIAVSASNSSEFFGRRKRVVVTGYPVRPDLLHLPKAEAKSHFGLSDEVPVLLVVGGSKGAHSINLAILEHLPTLLKMVQIIHITGDLDWKDVEEKAKAGNYPRYHPYPYLHEEMGVAFSAADLVLSRAGASVLGEYPAYGLPSILVPYPYAWRYQKVNAAFMEGQGAAITVEDEKLIGSLPTIISKLLGDPARLGAMRTAVRMLSKPQAASEIGSLLFELSRKGANR